MGGWRAYARLRRRKAQAQLHPQTAQAPLCSPYPPSSFSSGGRVQVRPTVTPSRAVVCRSLCMYFVCSSLHSCCEAPLVPSRCLALVLVLWVLQLRCHTVCRLCRAAALGTAQAWVGPRPGAPEGSTR